MDSNSSIFFNPHPYCHNDLFFNVVTYILFHYSWNEVCKEQQLLLR